VHFGMVNQSNFPNQQWGIASGTVRNFTLTFRNCPRNNFRYYFHANGTRWVGGMNQSVVGVQDSKPGIAPSNPIAGNPSGFAIQLQHRSDNRNQSNTGMNVYIHPNEVAQPQISYTRIWNGAGTVDDPTLGVTHTIPLGARLVRTGSSSQPIKTGPFNASVIVAIHYP